MRWVATRALAFCRGVARSCPDPPETTDKHLTLNHPMTCKQLARLVVSGGSCVLHVYHRVLNVFVAEPVSHKRHIGASIEDMKCLAANHP